MKLLDTSTVEVQIDRAWWEQGIQDGKVVFLPTPTDVSYHDAGLIPQELPS